MNSQYLRHYGALLDHAQKALETANFIEEFQELINPKKIVLHYNVPCKMKQQENSNIHSASLMLANHAFEILEMKLDEITMKDINIWFII